MNARKALGRHFKAIRFLWRSLRGKKISDFKSSRSEQVRDIDNLAMSQAWLSFTGFSNEAVHNKTLVMKGSALASGMRIPHRASSRFRPADIVVG
jgi:hypothetical protein